MTLSENAQVVLITGASSGIGEATARLLASRGYRLALTARRADRLDALAQEIEQGGGEALPIPADISQPAEITALAEQTLARFGHVDILLNNAGFGKFGWLEKLEVENDIIAQIQTNLLGAILTTHAFLPGMIARRSGHIINMASIAGLVATPTYSIYAASKFGLRGFSQALRREVGVFNIHVSTIYPGGVKTEFAEKSGATRRKTGVSTPRWLVLTAEDVAESVYRTIRRPRHLVVVPWMMRYAVWINNLAPQLADKIMERRFVRRERAAELAKR